MLCGLVDGHCGSEMFRTFSSVTVIFPVNPNFSNTCSLSAPKNLLPVTVCFISSHSESVVEPPYTV